MARPKETAFLTPAPLYRRSSRPLFAVCILLLLPVTGLSEPEPEISVEEIRKRLMMPHPPMSDEVVKAYNLVAELGPEALDRMMFMEEEGFPLHEYVIAYHGQKGQLRVLMLLDQICRDPKRFKVWHMNVICSWITWTDIPGGLTKVAAHAEDPRNGKFRASLLATTAEMLSRMPPEKRAQWGASTTLLRWSRVGLRSESDEMRSASYWYFGLFGPEETIRGLLRDFAEIATKEDLLLQNFGELAERDPALARQSLEKLCARGDIGGMEEYWWALARRNEPQAVDKLLTRIESLIEEAVRPNPPYTGEELEEMWSEAGELVLNLPTSGLRPEHLKRARQLLRWFSSRGHIEYLAALGDKELQACFFRQWQTFLRGAKGTESMVTIVPFQYYLEPCARYMPDKYPEMLKVAINWPNKSTMGFYLWKLVELLPEGQEKLFVEELLGLTKSDHALQVITVVRKLAPLAGRADVGKRLRELSQSKVPGIREAAEAALGSTESTSKEDSR